MTKTAADPSEAAILTLLADRPELSSAEVAMALGIGQSTAAKRLAGLEGTGKVRRRGGGRRGSRRLPHRWSVVPAKATPAARSEAVPARLGRGQLAELVLAELAVNPAEPVGPTQIAKALARSSGAVANALDRLVRSGEATLVTPSPRRYRLATSDRIAVTRSTPGSATGTSVRAKSKKNA